MEMPLLMWERDKFIKPHKLTMCDIENYINMREKNLRTVLQWEDIKHCHVTEAFRTIWSLTEASFLMVHTRGKPIGQEQPTLDFIKLIYNKLKAL